MNSRQFNRAQAREEAKKIDRLASGHTAAKVGPGRRMKWLMRHPKLAPFYVMVTQMLGEGAKWKAIRKMLVIVAQNPKVKHADGKRYPFIALQSRHQRGSWRAYPSVTIDANMKVAS